MKKWLLSNYKLIILIIILFVVIPCLFMVILFNSSLKINGEAVVTISYKEEYIERGASFVVLGRNFNKDVVIESDVVQGKVGKYDVNYKAKILAISLKKKRIVNIVDEDNPVINLKGEDEHTYCPSSVYEEEGYEAIDEYDGDITSNVESSVTSDGILYTVYDSSGNKGEVLRKIVYEDKEKPKISLKGNSRVYQKVNSTYKDLGYNVSDNCDKNVSVTASGSVDTSKVGEYKVKYTAKDTAGNESSVVRTVVVYSEDGKKSGVIYLTFDDGPSSSGTTEKILDVLKKENVKATFFVTGSGPDSLIKREYEEGHSIALHTNTHKYSQIYSSEENYFNDLLTVQKRVYNITGKNTYIMRFPGGSNNTVSNKYSKDIMSTLRNEVEEKGFTYFDWNVTSGDAGECSTSTCVYNNVVKGLSKKRNNIVLMHDIKKMTADAIEDIIIYGKANGYEFRVIDEDTPTVHFK